MVSPLSDPSGCEPCYSNELTICLTTEPVASTISGITPVCIENLSTPLTAQPVDPDYTYSWFWNGAPAGTGATINADEAGLYHLETSNGCQTTQSEFELEVCEVIALISCPLQPNPCACEGVEIILDGSASNDSCGEPLSFEWFIGNTSIGNSSSITHLPTGVTTYTLEVENTITGCTDTANLTITPCEKVE